MLEYCGTHSEGELVDLNAENTCGDVVAVFMYDYTHGYNYNESDNACEQVNILSFGKFLML